MNQVNPRLKKRLNTLLQINMISHAALEVLELRVNNLFELVTSAIAKKQMPFEVMDQVIELDRSLQELLIHEFTGFHYLKTMAAECDSDSKADMVCSVIISNSELATAKYKMQLLNINELQAKLNDKYNIVKQA